MVEVGKIYRHFKGNYYRVEGIATHSETQEPLVIYRGLKQNEQNKTEWLFYGGLWARPESMFTETITRDDKTFLRFEPVDKLPIEEGE